MKDNGSSTRESVLPKPIPERIKEAREARGFTLEAFAEALGVSRQAVAQFETGQSSPSGETLGRIVALTEQPIPFFVKMPQRQGAVGTVFWRNLKRMELHHRNRIRRRLQWASDITGFLDQFVELPAVNFPQVEIEADELDDEAIESLAMELRKKWKLGDGPIVDLCSVLEANGVLVIRESVFCDDMDAVSCWINGRPIALLSGEVESGPRDLFNLAHELGHLVLHASVNLKKENLAKIEKQANRFASAFLMPEVSFSREVFGTSIDFFISLKRRWGISLAAMIFRCKDLQIISENQYSYLFRQLNVRKMRRQEPLDSEFPVAKPQLLQQAFKMLLDHDVVSRSQIEAELSLNLKDAESLTGLGEGYLDQKVVSLSLKTASAVNDD